MMRIMRYSYLTSFDKYSLLLVSMFAALFFILQKLRRNLKTNWIVIVLAMTAALL
jgi:hypothetical protein